MVDGWLGDTLAGRDAAMYAWRRAHVDLLNQTARAAWRHAGRLDHVEVEAQGGRRYAAGDRIVTLAPSRRGLVTSERGTVLGVEPDTGRLTARMDDGRVHRFTRDELDGDRLDHGYATTIHRAQGATVDIAHRLADGGGRELAYVANSRARHHTTIHAVAEDLDHAREDLTWDWSQQRQPTWALDLTAPPRDLDRAAERTIRQITQGIETPAHERTRPDSEIEGLGL